MFHKALIYLKEWNGNTYRNYWLDVFQSNKKIFPFMLILELLMKTIYMIEMMYGLPADDKFGHSLYLFFYIVLLVTNTLVLCLFYFLKREIAQNITKLTYLIEIYCFFALFWASFLSIADIYYCGTAYTYFIVSIEVSCFLLIRPKTVVAMFLCCSTIFFYGGYATLGWNFMAMSTFINIILLYLPLIVVSIIKYNSKISDILNIKQFKYDSEVDQLTNLYNRMYLDKFIPELWERVKANDYPLSVAMADIDDFKKINDTYGHVVGDICIRVVSNTILEFSKDKRITPFRFGGEEFLILFEDYANEDALSILEQMRLEINRVLIDETEEHLSISIGACTSNSQSADFEQLLRIADKNLYKAKINGKNQVLM